jgi:hypothetical protein
MVITDRLGKGIIFKPIKDLESETIVWRFIKDFYAYHGLSAVIVSDHGDQFMGGFWTKTCELLQIPKYPVKT